MANLTAVISADTSKFVGGIKSAQEMLDKFVKDTNSATESTKKNVSATDEQVAAYKRVIQQLEKVGSGSMSTSQQQKALTEQIKELKVQWQNLSDSAKSSDFGKSLANTMNVATEELGRLKSQLASIDNVKPTGNLKQELRLTTVELQNLTAQYRALSAAEKQSPFGVELAAKMDSLRDKAGTLTDTIGDVQQEIKAMASDTPNLDVFNSALGIGADLISTYSGLVAKLTGDENALKEAIATIATVQSAANLATKLTNALQSSSVIMLKTRKIQESAAAIAIKVRTAAEGKGTIATKAATAAQAAFNVVAKANPYVLLATAVLAAGAAILAFSKNSKKAKEEEEAHQAALKKEKEAFQSFAESVGNAGGNLIQKYALLTAEYKNLSTEHEKLAWIKNNQKAFGDLGVSVNSVSDAENIFVKNTDAVVESIKKRALAAAKQNQLTELSAKLLEEQVKAEANFAKRQVKAGDKVGGSSHNSATGNEFVDRNGNWVYTAKGAEEANRKIKQESFALVDNIASEIQKIATEIAGSVDISTIFTTTGGGSQKATEEALEGSITYIKNQISEVQKLKDAQVVGTEEWLKWDNLLKDLNVQLEEAVAHEKYLHREALAPLQPIGIELPTKVEVPNTLQIKLPVQVQVNKKTFADFKAEIDSILDSYDKLANGTVGIVGSFNAVYDTFKNLNKSLEDAENGWESFFAVFQAGISVLDSIANMIQGITTIMEVLNTVKQTSKNLTQQDTLASITNTTAKTAEAGANTLAAGTAGAAAAAEAGKSVASIPYVGPVLAIAAIASVMAAIIGIIASAKSFATGGIIEGSNTIGDYNIARVNSGEMILNGTQQKKLFNLLDGNSGNFAGNNPSGQVEFKIKGTELIGVINNVNKKKSKI